jgi:hypothetical protein
LRDKLDSVKKQTNRKEHVKSNQNRKHSTKKKQLFVPQVPQISPNGIGTELNDGELEVVAGGEGLCLQAGKPVCGRCGVICVNGVPR